jgi:hypothetical protein
MGWSPLRQRRDEWNREWAQNGCENWSETSVATELVVAPGADITQCAEANYEIIPPQNAVNPPVSPGEGH